MDSLAQGSLVELLVTVYIKRNFYHNGHLHRGCSSTAEKQDTVCFLILRKLLDISSSVGLEIPMSGFEMLQV